MAAISVEYLEGLPSTSPRGMSPESAVRDLIEGHRAGHYALPDELVRVVDGTEALTRRHRETAATLTGTYPAGWEATLAGRVAAEVRASAWATGKVPVDPAARMLAASDEQRRLVLEELVLRQAAQSAETAPETVARSRAAAIGSVLDGARSEVLAEAAEPARHIVGLDLADPGALLAAPKAAQTAYEGLGRLLPWYGAILAAAAALAVLAPAHARSWPAVGTGHPVAELARAARPKVAA